MSNSSPSSSFQGQVELNDMQEKSYGADFVKGPVLRHNYVENEDDDPREDVDATQSNRYDQRDMQRLGRKQEMKRNFRPLSMLAFVSLVQATWESLLLSIDTGVTNAGLAGMVWSYIWVSGFFLFVVASLAEMASMAPTAGGQYHWVSEFAPPKYQKFLSYFAGWIATLAWQAGNASGPYINGSLIQSLISINNPDYDATNWQETLLILAITLLVYLCNVYLAKWIPHAQNILLAAHVLLFFAVIIPLWVLSPKAPAVQVFATNWDVSNGGWSNVGVSVLIAQITTIWGVLGTDSAAHMAEETKDAGRTVPRAMVGGYILNGILGFGLVITICFCIPNLFAALNNEYDWVFLYVLGTAMSPAAVTIVVTGLLVVGTAATLLWNVSTSRETFAFARDNGLPFSKLLSKIHPKHQVPVNSIATTCILTALLCLINIGSDTAFNALISLNTCALMMSYMLSLGCLIWRRIYAPETLPVARWSLGRWGLTINVTAFIVCAWCFFWSFWPDYYPVTTQNFNWSSPIFVAVVILALLMYAFDGRKHFVGPVSIVEGRAKGAGALGY